MKQSQEVYDKRSIRLLPAGWVVLSLCLAPLSALQAEPLKTPLQVAAAHPILNEFGDVIRGDSTVPAAERPLVHVMYVGGGVQPPTAYGEPQNQVLEAGGETAIGRLVASSLVRSGLFGASIAHPRPSDSQQVFVRVYNAPTYSDSLFYTDSQIMTVNGNESLFADFGPMTNIIHYRDADGDGLPDWWEHLHAEGDPTGIDANAQVPNKSTIWLEEYIAGTNPFDETDYFMITSIRPAYADTYNEHVWTDDDPASDSYGTTFTQRLYDVKGEVLSWPSVSDRRYRLEYITNLLTGTYQQLPGAQNLPSTVPNNVFTNTHFPEEPVPMYYRARVWMPEVPGD